MFKEKKAAQVAAYLLHRRGGTMAHLKLMKLMYLADRESFNRYGRSITEDRAYSLTHGPVLSQTLNLMDGDVPYEEDGWNKLITSKANNELSLQHPLGDKELNELSVAEIEILDGIFGKYGSMGRWELVKLTHQLPEWTDPDGSSLPIATHDILKALGKGAEAVVGYMARIEEDRCIDALLASL